MNDILFYALILALAYYLLIYLPQQKQNSPHKRVFISVPTQEQSTQTETNPDEAELENTLDTLIKNIQELNHQIN